MKLRNRGKRCGVWSEEDDQQTSWPVSRSLPVSRSQLLVSARKGERSPCVIPSVFVMHMVSPIGLPVWKEVQIRIVWTHRTEMNEMRVGKENSTEFFIHTAIISNSFNCFFSNHQMGISGRHRLTLAVRQRRGEDVKKLTRGFSFLESSIPQPFFLEGEEEPWSGWALKLKSLSSLSPSQTSTFQFPERAGGRVM
jgi:hypothetical protein